MTPPPLAPVPVCPLPLPLTTRVSVSSLLCSVTTRAMGPCVRLPSWGAVAGNCLCNPMTTYLYLAEKKWWRGSVQLNLCYGCNVRISQAVSWKAHWPWQCLSQGGFPHLTGLSTHWSLGPRIACPPTPLESRGFACSTLPRPLPTPRPDMRTAGTVGALMAFKCYSKTGKQAWKV